MTKRLLLSLLAIAVLGSTGCMFFRKNRKPKDSPYIATETEKEFKARWMAKRVSELAAQGVTGAAAQEQADRDYRAKYPFAIPSK